MSVVIGSLVYWLCRRQIIYHVYFNQCENNVIITPTIIGAISATNRVFNMVSPPSMLVKTRK